MNAERSSYAGRLLWCLQHYAWVVVVAFLALAAAPLMLAPSAPTYQADALVVARDFTLSPDALPDLAETMFANGAVEAAVTADPAVQDDADLVPDRLSVLAPEDSIALIVQARDADAATAVRMANLAAAAFRGELNAAGAGVGEFFVQAPAILPTDPLPELRPELRAVLGGLAGLALGLGVVALLAAIRKPVITFEDVEATAGVPLLGTVQLRRRSATAHTGPWGVRGIAGVTRWLSAVPPGRLRLVGPATDGDSSESWIRDRLFVMLGVALSRSRPVRLEGPPHLVDAVQRLGGGPRKLPRTQDTAGDRGAELVLIHDDSPVGLVDPTSSNVSVVAVVRRGASQSALRALTGDYVGGILLGVVLVDVKPGGRRPERQPVRAPSANRAPASSHKAVADVAEPGRA
ncbi:hypothetical protein [Blastococcus goldschmidtiae]|uniref:Capsular polysaccharide biosynthesis protein n=1 Tax=Blastococcus goldschmidtiae TaxID=3075546 RepID=A0ABU2KB11_9ACTN|nr:hypothetical protein [Blastococcus sp. DSM 46792]MDT0277379.1 hypothetical protein [Blastococcus sp. DSM 46792]